MTRKGKLVMRLIRASLVLGLIFTAWFLLVGQRPTSAASFISTGDGGWEWVKPARGVQNWGGVFFLDDKTGWVAGMDCVILKTSDGGKNWAPQGPRIRKILNDICFTDGDHGWAVGSGMASIDPTGIILKTSDGGATWRVVLDGKTDGLRSVCFVNNSVGWAVGGYPKSVILNTTDGGETWFEQDSGVRLQEKDYRSFEGVSSVDESTGYVLASTNGRVDVFKTTDGGKSWIHTPSQTKSPRSIQFLDADTGWILTQVAILRTTDGGKTWSEVSLDKVIPPDERYPARRNLQSFHFCDAQNGVAASIGGHVLRTGDGGNTWVLASSIPGETVSYPCVHMADEKNAWVAGYNGQMMRTSDGGSTWQSLSWGRDDYTHHIVFVSQEVGWAAGSVENSRGPGGVLLKTEDGGMTWSRRLVKESDKLGTLFFLGEKLAWVTASGGIVLKTTDGGVTWQAQ